MTRPYGTKLYRIWYDMLRRCENPRASYYYNYGGRGISVCPRWHHYPVFAADIADSIGLPECFGKGPGCYTFDRIDNDGNYEPGNVRWATWSQQMRNRRWPNHGPNPYNEEYSADNRALLELLTVRPPYRGDHAYLPPAAIPGRQQDGVYRLVLRQPGGGGAISDVLGRLVGQPHRENLHK